MHLASSVDMRNVIEVRMHDGINSLESQDLRRVGTKDLHKVVKTEAVRVELELSVLDSQDTSGIAGVAREANGTSSRGLAQAGRFSMAPGRNSLDHR
jgi:hypothetical protein